MKRNPFFFLAYWLQRLVVCPWNHGRGLAHVERMQMEQKRLLEQVQKQYGAGAQLIPGTPFFFVPDESGRTGGFQVDGNVVPLRPVQNQTDPRPL